ncbi:MAG: hypothetical protein AMXMBFR46_02580 [Acidimicrobiia bacterium]
MIDAVVEQWHRYVRGDLPGGLEDLLADDVVFYSPIVFTPQEGKAITRRYLEAAVMTLMHDDPSDEKESRSGFHYTKQVVAGDTAVLEFETTLRAST